MYLFIMLKYYCQTGKTVNTRNISGMLLCCKKKANHAWKNWTATKTVISLWLRGYNPRQHYLRKFSPSCPLSYTTKLFPKRRLCGKKTPSPNSMLLPKKRPGIRLSFEYTTTLLSGEGGEGRTGTATMFRKMLSKYTIFSTVLFKIVVHMSWSLLWLVIHNKHA